MYKLIALDLDGTLLDKDKRISHENLHTINTLIDQGYEVVIATGRRYWSAKELTKDIKGHLTIIANNGNMVRNSINDQEVFSKSLPMEDFRIILNEGRKRSLKPLIHVDQYDQGIDIIIEEGHEYDDYVRMNNRYKLVKDFYDLSQEKILAIVYGDTKDKLYPFYEQIINSYPDRYSIHLLENMDTVEAMLEVMHPQGDKWLSLNEYALSQGINHHEIIAIGDNNNDISMIENAGLGIAMKNASMSLKASASLTTDRDNNESGVAFILKRVLNM